MSRFYSAFIFILKASWMMKCQDLRVPFRNSYSDQGFRHQVRHRQFWPNVNPESDSQPGFRYSSETCHKASANAVLAMLAESKQILRLLTGKKGFCAVSRPYFDGRRGVTRCARVGRRQRPGGVCGFFELMQERLVHWHVCQLQANEINLRELFQHLD